jgi:hypothetical protein
VDTAAVIANAMTDYLLASGTNKAPASRAPAHMAAWLEARGYRIVRSPAPRPFDPGNRDEIARIASSIDWRSTSVASETRNEIVRQLVDAVTTAATVPTERRRSAWMGARYPSRFRPTIVRTPTERDERAGDTDESTQAAATPSSGYTELHTDELHAEAGHPPPCSSLCPCSVELPGESA